MISHARGLQRNLIHFAVIWLILLAAGSARADCASAKAQSCYQFESGQTDQSRHGISASEYCAMLAVADCTAGTRAPSNDRPYIAPPAPMSLAPPKDQSPVGGTNSVLPMGLDTIAPAVSSVNSEYSDALELRGVKIAIHRDSSNYDLSVDGAEYADGRRRWPYCRSIILEKLELRTSGNSDLPVP